MVQVNGNEFEIESDGLFVEGHEDNYSSFAFLIDDPSVRLDISKTDTKINVKVRCDYKFERNIAYIFERRYDEENGQRISDHWYLVKLDRGELKLIEYNRIIGYGEVILRDRRIINNGIFYNLTEFNKYL